MAILGGIISFSNLGNKLWFVGFSIMISGGVLILISGTLMADESSTINDTNYSYLSEYSCDDLEKIILLSNNSTLVTYAKRNTEKCLP